MAIGPFEANRVVAHEVHLLDHNVVGNARRVENLLAGPFIDAVRAFALPAEKREREIGLGIGPRNPENALFAEGLQIDWEFTHENAWKTVEIALLRARS